MADKQRLLSGIKPTGRLHIGNYFGAMRQFVELQDKYTSYIFIADYHALTSVQNAESLQELILNTAIDYLAVGLNPKKVVLFKQSDVPQHTELAWIFNCITTMPYLQRSHVFKDAQAKNKEIDVGTFVYPMLMAADILLYSPDVVPVGADQKQHIEYARDTAQKFNNIFGETFKLPKEYTPKDSATIPGVDGQKMSKSYNNTIPLFGSRDDVEKAVMGIVTDSGGDFPQHVYAIHKLYKSEDELKNVYDDNKGNYKALKEALIADVEEVARPLREKREELTKDKAYVLSVLKEGGKIAREIAEEKMKEIREKIGVTLQ
ncbi:tryptophan--tRNA ligase [Patescibacteria group bacterium]|nr:tryptophan--tRNA ligase [Patescibacteria group bacterium]